MTGATQIIEMSGVPFEVIIASFLVLCVTIIGGMQTTRPDFRFKRFVVWAIAIEYLFLVFCSTVLCRDQMDARYVGFEILPRYEKLFIASFFVIPWIWEEIILNIALFLPIGFLFPVLLRRYSWLWTLLAGTCLSVFIEILQYITVKGVCDINDVLLNSVGTLVGYGLLKTVICVKTKV